MNIKVHTGRVLAICSITGLALGLGLVFAYRNVEQQSAQLGPNSNALQQVDNVKTQLSWYLLSADLVLKRNESYMLNATLKQSDQILNLLGNLRESPLVTDKIGQLSAIEQGIGSVQSLVDEAATLVGNDRLERIKDIAKESDRIATPLVSQVGELKQQMERRSRYNQEDLEAKRSFVRLLSWLAAVLYMAVVTMTWFWSVQTVVRPIETLSLAAERAHLNHEAFHVEETGPEEVRLLTRNISAFVQTRANFLATMSHELRTPLNGILNMNELMLETELNEEQRDYTQSAKSAGEALLALISDILDFSKIEAKRLELESAPFDLRGLIDSAVEILAGVAEKKGIELGAVVNHDVPSGVVGDSTRLRQILMNLLNNAIKFTSEGRVVVSVSRVENEDPEVCELFFRITDTGIGIPDEVMPSLFRAFQQVDSSTTRKYGGSGLGLAICKELTTLMGGEIGVASEVGSGSTFWFSIRIGADPDAQQLRLPEAEGRSVVVLSDRVPIQSRLREQLLCLGLSEEAIQVVSPSEAMANDEAFANLPWGGEWWGILDPRGQADQVWATLQRLHDRCGEQLARVAVLTHPLRKRSGLGEPPREVVWLNEATPLETLRAWLLGRPVDAPTTTKPAETSKSFDQERHSRPGRGSVAGTMGHVLVAEDNAVNQKIMCAILERAGFEVTTVDDGRQAVEFVSAHACDLVLMDCQMPVMDGWESTRTIRELESAGRLAKGCPSPLPIVAVTANATEGDRRGCLEAGMNDHITKPVKKERLVELVRGMVMSRGGAEASAGAAAPELASSGATAPEETAARPRILVAEDNALNQRILRTILERGGCEVTLVENGQMAVDHVAGNPCDLVLMDMQMPVMDGCESTRYIRDLESTGQLAAGCPKRLPIIAVTANAMEGERRECFEAGMDEFVTKPLKAARVLELVKNFVSGRDPQSERGPNADA